MDLYYILSIRKQWLSLESSVKNYFELWYAYDRTPLLYKNWHGTSKNLNELVRCITATRCKYYPILGGGVSTSEYNMVKRSGGCPSFSFVFKMFLFGCWFHDKSWVQFVPIPKDNGNATRVTLKAASKSALQRVWSPFSPVLGIRLAFISIH